MVLSELHLPYVSSFLNFVARTPNSPASSIVNEMPPAVESSSPEGYKYCRGCSGFLRGSQMSGIVPGS